jgi:sulfur carrier protein
VTAVVLNGEPYDLPDGATVADAVVAAGAPADGRGVAAAIDGEVIPRGSWQATALAAGQHVEVLHAVQGG